MAGINSVLDLGVATAGGTAGFEPGFVVGFELTSFGGFFETVEGAADFAGTPRRNRGAFGSMSSA
jgi:hypothetical protein